MALMKCPECGNEVSDKAAVCPNCGVAIAPTISSEHEIKIEICPECGSEIDFATKICKNCGYNPVKVAKEKSRKKKKMITIVLCIVVVIAIIVGVVTLKSAYKETSYVVEACKELSNDENGLPNIKAIYTSDEVDDGDSTIDYVYRVYIEYFSGLGTKKVMYIVDKRDETHYITQYSKEKYSSFLAVAEMQIFGVSGFWEPSGNWDKMSSSDIVEIKNKVK